MTSVIVALFLTTTPSHACLKIYPKLKVGGASFNDRFFSLEDDDEGPVFNDNDESKLVFSTKEKKWCLKNAGKLDCQALNAPGVGRSGDKNQIVMKNKAGKPVAILRHGTRDNSLLMFSVVDNYDPSKLGDENIDRSKPWLDLQPSRQNASQLVVTARNRNGSIGRASHTNSTLKTRSLGGESAKGQADDKFTELGGQEMGDRTGCRYPPFNKFDPNRPAAGGSPDGQG